MQIESSDVKFSLNTKSVMNKCHFYHLTDASTWNLENRRFDNSILSAVHRDVCRLVLPRAVRHTDSQPNYGARQMLSHARCFRAPDRATRQTFGRFDQSSDQDQPA